MSLLNFLRKKPSASDPDSSAAKEFPHNRIHTRFKITDPSLAIVEHSRDGLFKIIDLSFRGCLVEAIGDALPERTSPPFMVSVHLAGRAFELEIAKVQKRRSGWALIFSLATERELLAMSQTVALLQCGLSMVETKIDSAPDYKRFHGDGPFDVSLEVDSANQVTFMMATLRQGDVYGSVLWENGSLITKRTIDARGVGARMSQTAEIDRDLVWSVATACLAMKQKEGALAAALLSEWFRNNS